MFPEVEVSNTTRSTITEEPFSRVQWESLSVNGLYQNSNAKSTKMAKIEVANTQSPVGFETVFCVS